MQLKVIEYTYHSFVNTVSPDVSMYVFFDNALRCLFCNRKPMGIITSENKKLNRIVFIISPITERIVLSELMYFFRAAGKASNNKRKPTK